MPVKILIPTPLRSFVGGSREVEVEGRTVGDALRNLVQRHGQLQKHLYADDGKLRSFVNVYVNDEDIRYLSKGETPVQESDVLSIVPPWRAAWRQRPPPSRSTRRRSAATAGTSSCRRWVSRVR